MSNRGGQIRVQQDKSPRNTPLLLVLDEHTAPQHQRPLVLVTFLEELDLQVQTLSRSDHAPIMIRSWGQSALSPKNSTHYIM